MLENRIAGLHTMRPPTEEGSLVDIIWNVTAICPWNCAACCVSAVNVKGRDDQVLLSSPDLSTEESLPRDPSRGTIFDQALAHRQQAGLELKLDDKMRVISNLRDVPVRLDISGGDALSARENYAVLEEAASVLGPDSVTLTATAAGLAGYDVDSVAANIAELNFTYDGPPPAEDALRPATYAKGNLKRAMQFARKGVAVRAECPLTTQNIRPDVLRRIYTDLAEAGVGTILLMRLFPVGRGLYHAESVPALTEYRDAIRFLRDLEGRLGGPKVKLQCALRALDGPSDSNPCDAIDSSFGLMWDGTLLGSPWAINAHGRPVDAAWVLGNLAQTSLAEILRGDQVSSLRARTAENHSHCKIFSWLNGASSNSVDRMFEKMDPLFIEAADSEDVA
ncbi:MAG: radical SAM protein [Brooklawnia sp.]|nr:radical SAM protein [Brooklawnia sp.]